MKLDSRASPNSLPLYNPYSLSPSNVSNFNPNPSDAISPTSPNSLYNPYSLSPSNVSNFNPNPSDAISPTSPNSLALYNPYSLSPSNVSNFNPNPSDAISPASPIPPTNETLNTTALEEIKAETANLLRRVEGNFLRQSNQRNRLQFANQMLCAENLALQSKVQDLETKLSDCILPSERRRLQYEHTQEVGRLTTDLQQTKELLASLRTQHGAQETVLRECQTNLSNSYIETEQLRQSVDAQVSVIANLRVQLVEKEKDIADLISKMNKPDMRLIYVRATLRESEASLAKAQDENENLRQVITIQREEISKLPVRSTADPTSSPVADDGILQNLARGQGRLSLEVKEVRQVMEQFISSSHSHNQELNTHPMAQYHGCTFFG